MTGLNIHIYPSIFTNESRIERISGALQATGLFSATHLLGIAADGLPSENEVGEDVVVHRLGHPRPSASGLVGKVRARVGWFTDVYRHYRHQPVAVVHAHSVWMLPVSWALSKRTGAVLSYLPEELETESARSRGLRRRVARVLERRLLGSCTVVCVVNPSIADWYSASYGRLPVSVRSFPNDSQQTVFDLRSKLGIPHDELLFVHTGHLIEGRSIPAILDAFAAAEDRHVVFIGDGKYGPDVRAASERHRTIHWLAPVSPADVVAYVRGADAALVLIEPTCVSFRLASPNKLFEALSAGIPPVCTDLAEARRLLRPLDTTWVGGPDEPVARRIFGVSRSDIETFRQQWPGLPAWSAEVAPLLREVESAVRARST